MLLVPELDDSAENLLPVRVGELDAKLREVVVQRGLSGEFAQRVAALAAEALGRQPGGVEIALGIAVGVYAGCLGEDIGAENRGIRRNVLAAEGFHQFGYGSKPRLVDVGSEFRVIGNRGYDLRKRGVTRPLAQTVDAGMHAGGPGLNRRDGIGGRQPVVVVTVEVEDRIGPGNGHHADEVPHVVGCENAQGVRQQNPLHLQVLQRVDKVLDVAEAVAKTV